MYDDDVYFDLAEALLECVKLGLTEACDGPPARTHVVIGPPAFDDCCDGQLTINLTRAFPSSTFPNEDVPVNSVCSAAYTALEYEIVLVRCMPDVTDVRDPVKVLRTAAEKNYREARIIRQATLCCMKTMYEMHNIEVFDRGQTFIGPEGGCIGSQMSLTLGINDGCGCGS